MNDQYIEFDDINTDHAIDYILGEMIEAALASKDEVMATKEGIRKVLAHFWEYVAQHHMTVEVDLDWEGEE